LGDFKELANCEYDSGYGALEVAKDLLVVGKDWWLERHEYEGLEWWEYKTMPARPKNYRKPLALTTRQAREVFGEDFSPSGFLNLLNEQVENEDLEEV